MSDRPPRHLRDGERAERIARSYLSRRGLTLIASNYRCTFGEVDLIMEDSAGIVFVEVRYRRRPDPVQPADTVTAAKRRRIAHTSLHFLQQHQVWYDRPLRFDVVAVSGPIDRPHINWIRGAFDADELPAR